MTTDNSVRPDQVQLAGGCGASLRIFDDGGWELRSVNKPGKENKKGCNIIARGEGGLQIYSDGDVNIDAKGDFNVSAKNITMETTADDGDFTVFCKRDIMLDADNNFKAFGTKCVVSAADNLITHSKGWNLISSTTSSYYNIDDLTISYYRFTFCSSTITIINYTNEGCISITNTE